MWMARLFAKLFKMRYAVGWGFCTSHNCMQMDVVSTCDDGPRQRVRDTISSPVVSAVGDRGKVHHMRELQCECLCADPRPGSRASPPHRFSNAYDSGTGASPCFDKIRGCSLQEPDQTRAASQAGAAATVTDPSEQLQDTDEDSEVNGPVVWPCMPPQHFGVSSHGMLADRSPRALVRQRRQC